MKFLWRCGLILALALPAGLGLSLKSLAWTGAAAPSRSAHNLAKEAGSRTGILDQDPNCGRRAHDRDVVQTYKMKRFGTKGYRTATLYCGKDTPPHGYGYRHLKIHVGQYFGGWGNFDFSIKHILLKPATIIDQKERGTYLHSGPIYECFPTEGFYIKWTFYVATAKRSGSIITAFGREGKKVEGNCPP